MRGLMLVEDDLHLTSKFRSHERFLSTPEVMLLDLLKHNGENRMAFEYLMAICLCNNDVASGGRSLFSFLDGLSYPATPPLYEEAVLIYLDAATPKRSRRSVPTSSSAAGRSVGGRWRSFAVSQAIAALNGGLNEKAEAAVARELGDTYFYYYFYAIEETAMNWRGRKWMCWASAALLALSSVVAWRCLAEWDLPATAPPCSVRRGFGPTTPRS